MMTSPANQALTVAPAKAGGHPSRATHLAVGAVAPLPVVSLHCARNLFDVLPREPQWWPGAGWQNRDALPPRLGGRRAVLTARPAFLEHQADDDAGASGWRELRRSNATARRAG